MSAKPVRYVVVVDGESHTAVLRRSQPSAWLLTVHSVLADPPLAVEIHSSFTGHRDTATHATHLLLGPVGASSRIRTPVHDADVMQPGITPERCVLEHLAQLIDLLTEHGHHARVGSKEIEALLAP